MYRVNAAVYVGRFHLFHIAHQKSIASILETGDKIVMAIGSADSSHTSHNPFKPVNEHG